MQITPSVANRLFLMLTLSSDPQHHHSGGMTAGSASSAQDLNTSPLWGYRLTWKLIFRISTHQKIPNDKSKIEPDSTELNVSTEFKILSSFAP